MKKSHLIASLIGTRFTFYVFYFLKRKKFLSLSNPKDFSEKIIYRRLFPKDVFSILADKVAVRDYVLNKIGSSYLIPVYGIYRELSVDILEKLPGSFIIKTNHGAGLNIIVRDKSNFQYEEICERVNSWLQLDYSRNFEERHYQNIQPQVIIEKLLITHGDLWDYKIHVFHDPNSKIYTVYIQIITDRYSPNGKIRILWLDENLMSAKFTQDGFENIKPESISLNIVKIKEAIVLAKKLTGNLHYCRVDFYIVNDKIFFGEMTFTPYGGNIALTPKIWDRKFGELFIWPEPEYKIINL
jgi:hypothetical protein